MGAWIETRYFLLSRRRRDVAPYVGAWIETTMKGLYEILTESHPTWVRGLKLALEVIERTDGLVAPYVGAWIETSSLSTLR